MATTPADPGARGTTDPATAAPPPRPPGAAETRPDLPLTRFQRAVADVVGALQPGEVVSYADVAAEIGSPGSAQAVANVLRRVPDLPWWRVVPADGRLYRTHAPIQRPLLEREGVTVGPDRRVSGAGPAHLD